MESVTPPYVGDSPELVFVVTAPDSTAQLNWWSTSLLVETDREYREEIVLRPYRCIVPNGQPEPYPLNYDWLACGQIGINNKALLTPEQVAEVERVAGGRLALVQELQYGEYAGGAQYFFETYAVGRPTLTRAIEQVRGLDFVRGEVYHPTAWPTCVLSDMIPPPPCPPWELSWALPMDYGDGEAGGEIPVRAGGWVRATYTEADGTVRTTTFTVPDP